VSKALPDAILDAIADAIIAGATTIYVCSAQPANFAGIAALALADVTVDSGDFTKADGDSSGRKVTVSQQTGVTIDVSGTATHVVGASGSVLLYVTTCASQALTASGTVTISSHKIECADPV